MNHLKKDIPISKKTIEKLDKYEHNYTKANRRAIADNRQQPLSN
jgi:hypothetical protein